MAPSGALGAAARAATLLLIVAATAAAAGKPDALLAARRFYNSGQYDQAIQAAGQAAANPSFSSSARLVLGRSRLERYRNTNAAKDLDDARADLHALDPRALDARERIELQIGLAVLLYVEDRHGAAAEMLDPLIEGSTTLAPDAPDRALDWWATALHRQAQALPPADREPIYARLVDRMERELRRDPASSVAGYWLPAAASGSGDLDRAWALAIAGWVRAPFGADHGAALRADLDKLVTQAIIPARAARLPQRERRQAIMTMTADWEAFKTSW